MSDVKPLSVNELADFMADISRFKTSAARLLATIEDLEKANEYLKFQANQRRILMGLDKAEATIARLEIIEAAAREADKTAEPVSESRVMVNRREWMALRDALEGR